MSSSPIAKIVKAYRNPVVRAYCWGRFLILRQRFLNEISQYLPAHGNVLDVGCGFGLFSLYFAHVRKDLQIFGVDINERRIGMAQEAADELGINNVAYGEGDARDYLLDRKYVAIYMLDIVHHIPRSAVRPLLERLSEGLESGGILLIKDVASRPILKRWFTWWLDKAMDPRAPVSYWHQEELITLLTEVGFRVYSHEMVDILPYPHVLYICHKD